MENYKYDLDKVGGNIKRAADSLNCFCEFCDEEGHFGKSKDFNEKAHKAIAFVDRMDTYRSLVDTSVSILYNEYDYVQKALNMKSGV